VGGANVICRLYSTAEENREVAPTMEGLRAVGLRAIGGDEIAQIAPCQIGELILKPESNTSAKRGGEDEKR